LESQYPANTEKSSVTEAARLSGNVTGKVSQRHSRQVSVETITRYQAPAETRFPQHFLSGESSKDQSIRSFDAQRQPLAEITERMDNTLGRTQESADTIAKVEELRIKPFSSFAESADSKPYFNQVVSLQSFNAPAEFVRPDPYQAVEQRQVMKSPQFAPQRSHTYDRTEVRDHRHISHESQRNFNEKLSNLKNALTNIKSNLNNFKVNSAKFTAANSGNST
jgi:hypothetical protein